MAKGTAKAVPFVCSFERLTRFLGYDITNDTYIVSAGEYGKYLGVVQMACQTGGTATLTDYALIPIDETVAEEPAVAALVEGFKATAETDYLAKYGVTFDEVLTTNSYRFDTVDEVYDTSHESTLGNVFSNAYKWAVESATGQTVDVALTASGVIRECIPTMRPVYPPFCPFYGLIFAWRLW